MYECIPNELKQLKQWVCWKKVKDDARPEKFKKVPVNAKTGGAAQSNNPATWCDYETAVQVSVKYTGIGFMFANGYFGVDIDDIRSEIEAYQTGDMDNIVAEFIHSLESYSEFSQSGNGIHIICKGHLPEGGRRKGKVEMYQEGRFFIMTGNIAAEYAKIEDCTESIKLLHSKYIGNQEPIKTTSTTVLPLDLDNEKLIEIALKSKQGQAFDLLYHGSWEGFYSNQSDADMAFCNMLAFWCAKDKVRMDMIFRQSGLMRDKWDRRTGNSTYGEITLNKAISSCQNVFSPGSYQSSSGTKEDFSIVIGEQPRKFYSYDDTGNAKRFTDRFQGIIRYNYIHKCWYVFNGKRWVMDETGAIKRLADKLIDEMESDIAWISGEEEEKAYRKHLKYTKSSKGKNAMLKESEHIVSITPNDFDKGVFLLNAQNGTLDLKTGKLLPHDAEQYLSKICNVEYTDKADCPQWMAFLNVIFDCDRELIRYMQKVAGIFLTGSIDEQAVFFLYGNGRNGKSTFVNALYNILGDYTMTTQPETIMFNKLRSTSEYEVARMKSARLVTTAEPTEGMRINESFIKQVTGGEELVGRILYGMPFSFLPEYKLCMSTNYKPVIRGRDDGIWRRVHLIPFNVQIPKDKVDKKLPYKLRKEYPGILNWAVEGCLLWQKEGLEMPQVVADATAEYRAEMDLTGIFLSECTELDKDSVTNAADLFNVYVQWANKRNEHPATQTRFGRDMGARFERVHRSDGQYYKGMKLKSEYVLWV